MSKRKFASIHAAMTSIALITLVPSNTYGQNQTGVAPRYSELTFLVGPYSDVGTPTLTDAWDPAVGITIAGETPFSFGRLGLTYQTNRYRGNRIDLPEFRAHTISTTWGLELPVQTWLRLYGGVSAGAWVMSFSAAGSGDESTLEMEIAGGAHSRVSLCPLRNRRMCFFSSFGVTRILTEPRINQRVCSVGASVTVGAPGWVKTALDGRIVKPPPQPPPDSVTVEIAGEPETRGDESNQGSGNDDSPHPRPGRTVITDEEIRRSGLSRLGDVLSLIDSWTTTTVDYFSWWATPPGLGSPLDASYSVMVGNQPLELGPGEIWNLNRIGLGLEQIDSIEVFDTPQLVAGRFTSAGMIRFHPRQTAAGPALHAHGMMGNSAGDPGPHRYTSGGGMNVDRTGHGAELHLFNGGPGLGLEISLVQRRHFATDPRIYARTSSAARGVWPHFNLIAPSLRLRLGRESKHMLELIASRFDNYRFVPVEAREVPVRRDWLHAGVDGALWSREKTALKYRVSTDRSTIRTQPNNVGVQAHSTFTFQHIDLELQEVSHLLATGSVGIGLDFESFDSESSDMHDVNVRFRAYAKKRECLTTEICVGAQVLGSVDNNGTGGSLQGSVEWDPRTGFWASGSLALEHSPGPFVADLWLPDRSSGKYNRVSGSLEIGTEIASDLSIASDLFVRRIDQGRALRDATGSVLENMVPTIDSVLVDMAPFGSYGGVEFKVEWLAGVYGARSFYSFQHDISASPGMERRSSLIPKHRFRQVLWVGIGGEMNAQITAEARSGVSVPGLSQQGDPAGVMSTDASVVLGVAVLKWFWQRRMRGTIRVRDFLNNQQPVHPLGAAPGFTLFVQADLMLPGSERQ